MSSLNQLAKKQMTALRLRQEKCFGDFIYEFDLVRCEEY